MEGSARANTLRIRGIWTTAVFHSARNSESRSVQFGGRNTGPDDLVNWVASAAKLGHGTHCSA
jgi:hypothetical protein